MAPIIAECAVLSLRLIFIARVERLNVKCHIEHLFSRYLKERITKTRFLAFCLMQVAKCVCQRCKRSVILIRILYGSQVCWTHDQVLVTLTAFWTFAFLKFIF